VTKPAAEKKKKPKVIVCSVEIDGEIHPGRELYFPALDPREVFDMPIVDANGINIIKSLIKIGVDFVSVSGIESRDDLH
jgi:pyruvate kinase